VTGGLRTGDSKKFDSIRINLRDLAWSQVFPWDPGLLQPWNPGTRPGLDGNPGTRAPGHRSPGPWSQGNFLFLFLFFLAGVHFFQGLDEVDFFDESLSSLSRLG
jgi:hypothetical protein